MTARQSPAPKASQEAFDIAGFELDPQTVHDRFRWARRSGHPLYLWPDLPIQSWRHATAVLAGVMRRLVAGKTKVRLDRPAGVTTRGLGIAAYATGVGPLLGYWSQTDRLATDEETAALLALHLDQGRRRFARVERFATDALRLVQRADKHMVILKGLHTAREYFPEPGTRPVADVDVLITERAVGPAEHALEDAGFTPTTVLRSPYRRDWVRSESRLPRSLEVDHVDNPIALDLHSSLARVFSGTRSVDLTAGGLATIPWSLGDIHAGGLAQPLLTAFLALHASEELHHLRLIRLFELIRVIRKDTATGGLDWRPLRALLTATNSARFCYPAFALAEKLAPGTIAPDILNTGRAAAGAMMRRVVDRLEPENCLQLNGRSLFQRFMWAATPAEALRCAAYTFRPSRTNAAPFGQVVSERFFRLISGRVFIRS